MENLIKSQQILRIWLGFACCCLMCICCLSTSTQTSTFDDLCSFEGMCLNCSDGGCDDMCQFYDNPCCVDKSSTNILLKKWQYSCVRKYPDMYDLHLDCRGSFDGVYGVYMVTKCSELWKDEPIRSKCENSSEDDVLSRIPVYDNFNEIVTFKNMHCAFCNMVPLGRIRFWKFDLMCNVEIQTNKGDYEKQNAPGACFVRLVYREHRMCAFNVIESCAKTQTVYPLLRDKCEKGLAQNVYVWKNVRTYSVYKNEFCAMCNFESGDLQCWAFQAFTCWPQDLPPYNSVKAIVSLDINGSGNKNATKLYKNTCGDAVLYDPFDNSCLNTTCLPSVEMCISGRCHLVKLKAKDFMIQNDSSLYYFDLGNFIPEGRYFVKDSNVHVCLDDNQFSKHVILQETTTLSTTEATTKPTTAEATVILVTFSNGFSSRDMSTEKLIFLIQFFLFAFNH